jgi:sialic acid synthase SpsE
MHDKNKLNFIAEVGVNHNGSLNNALKLVDVAKSSGADIVKFQVFKAETLASDNAKLAEYQKKNTNNISSQRDLLQQLELADKDIVKISKYCEDIGIEFLATAFDIDSLKLLKNETNINRIKIASGEVNNAPLLIESSRIGLPIILSTGMCRYTDIEAALSAIAYGFLSNENENPSLNEFDNAYNSREGQNKIKEKVTLLHCTSEYPAEISESNLSVIKSLNTAFGTNVGFSDHTKGFIASVVAIAFGARVFEKHITLDTEMIGPDHKASMEPKEFLEYIEAVQLALDSLGDGVKVPTESEIKNKSIVRKSIVAAKDIKRDHFFTEDDIAIIRSSGVRSPFDYWDLLGTPADKDYLLGDPIE